MRTAARLIWHEGNVQKDDVLRERKFNLEEGVLVKALRLADDNPRATQRQMRRAPQKTIMWSDG